MTNSFYTPTGNPAVLTPGSSALMRAEFQAIANAISTLQNIGGLNSGIDTGTANTYVITPSPAMQAYAEFVWMIFIAANTNTGASTINGNGLGAIPIVKQDGTALLAGDIQAGGMYFVICTSPTSCQLTQSGKAAGVFTTVSASGQITSTLANGTAPFVVTSSTVVSNLNVSQLLGNTWVVPGAIGATTPSTGKFTTVNGNTLTTGTYTLTGGAGKTLTFNNSLTLAGTDATTMTLPPASSNIGYLNIPQNSQSANYTTLIGDEGKCLFHPSSDNNARTFTIDSNANVAFEIGAAITFVNMSATALSIAITADTMYLGGAGTTGTRTLAQYGVATALKIDSTHWIISGSGLT